MENFHGFPRGEGNIKKRKIIPFTAAQEKGGQGSTSPEESSPLKGDREKRKWPLSKSNKGREKGLRKARRKFHELLKERLDTGQREDRLDLNHQIVVERVKKKHQPSGQPKGPQGRKPLLTRPADLKRGNQKEAQKEAYPQGKGEKAPSRRAEKER